MQDNMPPPIFAAFSALLSHSLNAQCIVVAFVSPHCYVNVIIALYTPSNANIFRPSLADIGQLLNQ